MSKLGINPHHPHPITNENLLSRKDLAKNSLINLAGFALPLTVGLITIPLIVRGFGLERFGLLTLAWAVVGYFSLFDFGIGRAITQSIAERLDKSPAEEVARLAWTGLLMMAVFALIGAIVIASLTPWFVSSVLNVPKPLRDEALWAFLMLAMAIPAVVLSAGFSGVLTAIRRFDLINALRIPMGMTIFLVPLAILPYSKSIAFVCAGLMSIRILFLVLYAVACFHAFPPLRANVGIERSEIGRLLTFGGWMTVTNIIGPFMMYMDRFVIGATMSIAAVSYYVTPYEMVTRILVIPAAIVAVLFPAFAASKESGLSHAATLYSLGGRAILGMLAPVVLVLVVFAREGMYIWLDSDFSQKSAPVLQWLAIGVYLNSYAQVPTAFIQGIGRADITAKLHLWELPAYITLVFWLLKTQGIIGVAIAWVLRACLDAVLLTLIVHWLVKDISTASKKIYPMLVAPLGLFAIGMALNEVTGKVVFISLAFLILGIVSYFFAITPEEKNAIQKSARRFLRA